MLFFWVKTSLTHYQEAVVLTKWPTVYIWIWNIKHKMIICPNFGKQTKYLEVDMCFWQLSSVLGDPMWFHWVMENIVTVILTMLDIFHLVSTFIWRCGLVLYFIFYLYWKYDALKIIIQTFVSDFVFKKGACSNKWNDTGSIKPIT